MRKAETYRAARRNAWRAVKRAAKALSPTVKWTDWSDWNKRVSEKAKP